MANELKCSQLKYLCIKDKYFKINAANLRFSVDDK